MVCCPWYERGPADSRPRAGLEYAAIRNVEQCNWFILLQHNIIYYALPLLLLIIDEIVIIPQCFVMIYY